MKHFLIIFDGMADEPLKELDGKTPMQVARKPFMNALAEQGMVGAANTTPEGMSPGSDVTNMGILGYDPKLYYTGRAAIEAASLQVPMEPTDVAFRTNLVSSDGETMIDSSAGHITTEEAWPLIELIREKLSTNRIRFYPGVSYRHLMVWGDGSMNVHLTAPYKFHGKPLNEHLPEGDNADQMTSMIYDSFEILDNHPINKRRRDQGLNPANMIWFWAEGTMPNMPSFLRKTGYTGAVVAAVDLIKGLGRMVGLEVMDVPGATGYIDTNFLGKGSYAVDAADRHDFVWVHVEAADEAGHEQDIDKKIKAIEDMDEKVLGTILHGMKRKGHDFRILLMPDHPTPIATGSHSSDLVPFLVYDSTAIKRNILPYDERAVPETKTIVEFAPDLINILLDNN